MADDISVLTKEPAASQAGTASPDKAKKKFPVEQESEKAKLRRMLKENPEDVRDLIKAMTPDEIFTLCDEDESGLVSFHEFRDLLPLLGININDAKAYRYFKICDTDGSGEIDIDEFKVSLFLCDPNSGNPVGFVPGNILTPMDAFETFDEDGTGYIDEDEFYYAMDYLGLKLSDHRHEKVFYGVDFNKTASIDYLEFREVFIRTCKVKRELEDRGIEVPSFAFRSTLENILREALDEEEDRERRAVAEAKRFKEWIFRVKDKKRLLRKARWRSDYEIKAALDAVGQVYVFGEGSHGQFASNPSTEFKTKHFQFQNFEKVVELWRNRVKPDLYLEKNAIQHRADVQEEKRYEMQSMRGLSQLGALSAKSVLIDPYQEAEVSQFRGLVVASNTCTLWGRRIHHVSVSENCIFALSDLGEVFCWGGNSYWWHEIQPDSVYQSKWRGDITPRSQLLLGIQDRSLPPDVNATAAEGEMDDKSNDEKKAEMIKVVTKYFNCWEPPPSVQGRMQYLEKDLFNKVTYDAMKFALECRGKEIGDVTKLELLEELYNDILLEKRLLGERAHKAIKELENQVSNLKKRRKFNMAYKVQDNIRKMWEPLKEVQAEKRAAEKAAKAAEIHNKAMKIETDYTNWRKRVQRKREQMDAAYSPRGNSLALNLSGVTPRGPDVSTPRGFQSALQIQAGNAHVCLVHKNGQLYSWGVGASGRLGLDMTEGGDPQKDVVEPKLVQALNGRPVVRVSCGYNHTGAIVAGGELYMWGSAANGKCGLGNDALKMECYCSIPTRVLVGKEDKRVRKISCGSAHTAVVTEQGHLYVTGCGDGGRLGLGEGRYDAVTVPVLVENLLHEKIASVSCGNSTTVAVTEISHGMVGEKSFQIRKVIGGKVYIAGSGNVFGRQYSTFTYLKDMDDKPVKQASAGYQHTALVTADGELYCWGRNNKVCCGTSPASVFIEKPTAVTCLFQNVFNLALGCEAEQSSTYNNREAGAAVNGVTDGFGLKMCTSTQQDAQAWWEVDLGRFALIDEIRIWNRTDSPHDKHMTPDTYSARLFPCWVMVGHEPFDRSTTGMGLQNSLLSSVAKVKFTENTRVSSWRCPNNTQGRYVRVQLEGFNFLTLAEVQVFGNWGISTGVGRASYAVAGRDVTVAVIRPIQDPTDLEDLYRRAAYADAENADILRQYESYALEYDKFGRGEVLKKCSICRGNTLCEICNLYKSFQKEIEDMPSGIGGRRRRLNSIDYQLVQANKPELIIPVVPRKVRPSPWQEFKDKWGSILNPRNWCGGRQVVMPEIDRNAILLENVRRPSQDEGSVDTVGSLVRKREQQEDASVVSIPSSIGESILRTGHPESPTKAESQTSKKMDQSVASKYTVGETTASGHTIKNPYPKSIASKMDESRDMIKKTKEKAEAEKAKAKKRKNPLLTSKSSVASV